MYFLFQIHTHYTHSSPLSLLSYLLLHITHTNITISNYRSRVQAQHLKKYLGDEYGMRILSCDPNAWAESSKNGPKNGQARDGNGFIWLKSRLELIGKVKQFWLSDTPDVSCSGSKAWGGSPFQRTCAYARFRDLQTGAVLIAFSCHFDHEGDDVSGGSLARVNSAKLVMSRARSILRDDDEVDVAIVAGDCNTFRDRDGACYKALVNAAGSDLIDVRHEQKNEFDAGRAASSWEGWASSAWCRAKKGDQRYDQMFVSTNFQVIRTAVQEDSFVRSDGSKAYASDHLPIVTDGFIKKSLSRPKKRWLSNQALVAVSLLVCCGAGAFLWSRRNKLRR